MGRCNHNGRIITVDIDKCIASTLIHEIIHAENPNFPEAVVMALEEVAITGMTPETARKIVRAYGIHWEAR